MILFVVIMKNRSGSKTVDLDMSKYVKVEYNGYNGIGTASVSFDQDSFYDEYADIIKYAKDKPRDAKDYYDAAEYIFMDA